MFGFSECLSATLGNVDGFAAALGARVRFWREGQGLSLREASMRYSVAMRLEKPIPASRWVAIEQGKRQVTVPELIGLSMALDVPVPRLLDTDGEDAGEPLADTPQGHGGGMSLAEVAGALKRNWVRHVDQETLDALAAGYNLPALESQIARMCAWDRMTEEDGRDWVRDAAVHLYGCDVLRERAARTLAVVQERKAAGETVSEEQVRRIAGHATRKMADEIYEAVVNGEV